MLDETLVQLERAAREDPGSPERFLGWALALERAGRLDPELPLRDLPPESFDHWRHDASERSLERLFLPALGLERPGREEGKPGLWWSQELRIAESDQGFHDPVSGWPLVVRRRSDGALMDLVPAGPFLAGPKADEERITGSFYLDRFPVTQGRFLAGPGGGEPEGRRVFLSEDSPRTQVTWFQAEAYGQWAGGELPTVLEWEKAARGTDGRRFPWGDEWPGPASCNWFHDEGQGDRYAFMDHRLAAISSFPRDQSPFGIRGLAGNCSDWCQDELPGSPEARRAVRGGNYHSFSSFDLACSVTSPGGQPPGQGLETLGFRLLVRIGRPRA